MSGRIVRLLVSCCMLAAAGSARAATDTDQLTVTATVQSGCSLGGGTMNFGQYTAGQAVALDAVGEIRFTNCVGTLRFELDGGASANVNQRQMSSGSNRLNYQLYRNSTRSQIFANGSNSYTLQVLEPLSGTVDVYGRIPAGQAVAAGTYTDNVTITLTF